jgi:hypothetical protein
MHCYVIVRYGPQWAFLQEWALAPLRLEDTKDAVLAFAASYLPGGSRVTVYSADGSLEEVKVLRR